MSWLCSPRRIHQRTGAPRTVTGGDADDTVAHHDAWLLGEWQVLRCEPPLEIQPGTRMHFRVPDELEYTIPAAERTLMTTLRWRLEGAGLRTEHPDGSNPVSVGLSVSDEGILTFDFDGPRAWFVRAS